MTECTETKTCCPETSTLAGKLYGTYCSAVGGVAFNGEPLPTWEVMSQDPTKTKQTNGWYEVAKMAIECFMNHPTPVPADCTSDCDTPAAA